MNVDKYKELIQTQKEYIALLGDELGEVVGFAWTHGWRSTRFETGKILREKINKLEKEIENG